MGQKVKRYFESSQLNDTADNSKTERKNKKHKKFFPKKDENGIINIKAKLKPRKQKERYPGKAPISKDKLKKFDKGEGLDGKGVSHKIHLKKLRRKEHHIAFATKLSARTELILPEDAGYLEADEGETTTQFTQKQITNSVDIATAAKHFELHLNDFGPYRMKYTRNGRHLLLGGRMGHIAAIDWFTKKLHCEINVTETVHDISWLHQETMFAVAQKDWVYIYDKGGVELHCLKQLHNVLRMEFLPYHFLLATGSENGHLSWLDVSIGEIVGHYGTKAGRIMSMKQNPYNGVLCVGQANGVVSMWCPKNKKSLATLLCHKAPLSSVAIDPRGTYMATSAVDRNVKIWDVRKLMGPLQTYFLRSPAHQLEFSHNNLLSMAMGNVIEVYRDCCTNQAERPYLLHKMNAQVQNMSFCPYEDILGVATDKGFVSLIVPGSGEANFDALESNPYETKSQRRETEVKSLLEKLQPEFICLEPSTLAEVNIPTLKNKMQAHNMNKSLKPKTIDYTPRKKTKGKGSAKVARNKKIVKEVAKREMIKEIKMTDPKPEKNDNSKKSYGVLDRFVKKK